MSNKQVILVAGIATTLIAGAVALFFFDPAKHAFFPKCAFHVATGYSCPGCGSSRAIYQLTHGNVLEAVRLNPGVMFLLGMGVTDVGRYIRSVRQTTPFQTLFANTRLVIGLLTGMTVYAVLRNLPFTPFSSLAP
ncbi:MAG TPA: DUF2752 domain-containing protein [Verrucomicrobiota bacterium]|jgi:hypothetical protein|nr:DUF2752 domain-containing protein [Verrucomicrobiota bacterium]